jgi:hypothetical protein
VRFSLKNQFRQDNFNFLIVVVFFPEDDVVHPNVFDFISGSMQVFNLKHERFGEFQHRLMENILTFIAIE